MIFIKNNVCKQSRRRSEGSYNANSVALDNRDPLSIQYCKHCRSRPERAYNPPLPPHTQSRANPILQTINIDTDQE